MDSTLKYAEHKLDEAIKQGETDVDISYWRGYRDCAKVMERKRIDREAFGCEFCDAENHCANCLYDNLPGQMEPCRSCEAHNKWETASRFCQHCGKPLTEEAWAELEKRMRG